MVAGTSFDLDRDRDVFGASVEIKLPVLPHHLVEAVERARKEDLPTLIEARTYRFMGHSMSDPTHGSYRTREELAEHRRRDPIKRLTSTLESLGIINQEYMDDLDRKIHEVVDQAAAFADESPFPPPEELTTDVYLP